MVATVVEVPLSAVVLNPRSHRIRAQLESSAKRELIARDPYGEDAQEAIAVLLRTAERFDLLKDNLKEVGQADPGVITHTGLLVNANTRCVALRDLAKRHIRAAVLPEDANEEEIDRLELRLQMRRDFMSEYTFTNELLFVDDLVKKYRYKPNEIAVEMRWASKSDKAKLKGATEQVQQYLRMLGFLREVQDLSGGVIPLTRFDDARQAISELDADYEQLKKRNSEAAKKLREIRSMALIAGTGYREMREIDESFIEEYLLPSLDDQPQLRGNIERAMQPQRNDNDENPPGVDVLDEDDNGNGEGNGQAFSVAPLLSRLAESEGKANIVIPGPKGAAVEIPRGEFLGDLKGAVESAAEDARLARTEGSLLDRPRLLLRKAGKQVRGAREAYRQAHVRDGFDGKAFGKAVEDLDKARDALQKLVDGKDD